MTDESNTPETSGTDNVTPDQTDTEASTDQIDPEESQDTDAGDAAAETDDGTQETAQEDAPRAEVEAPHDAVVTLDGGQKVKVSDLIRGNLMQQDYTRKSQALANERQAVQAHAARIETVAKVFSEHLATLIPQAPDPMLAATDPNAYVRQKALHEAASAQVADLIAKAEGAKEVAKEMDAETRSNLLATENRLLAQRFPATGTAEGRQKFFEGVASAAAEIGFSLDELQGLTDHRIFAALHYVGLGLQAEKARATAKAKAQAAPPVAPQKAAKAGQAQNNGLAMATFKRTGSWDDALKIDF